ncbi:lysostaphin resistance A-like protein [Neisseria sp.]|uniref:CPBP family intramembrane glutamic endopeptidase n=1 Tax=Neisseria sp. TaxID=192066 RepID=UPI00359FBDA4
MAIETKRAGIGYWVAACAVCVLLYVATSIVLGMVASFGNSPEWTVLLLAVAVFSVMMSATFAALYFSYRKTLSSDGLFARREPFWQAGKIGFSAAAAVAMACLPVLYQKLFLWAGIDIGAPPNQKIVIELVKMLHPILGILYVAVFAPVAEELLFRGLVFNLFGRLGKRWQQAAALLLSSLLFALPHLPEIDEWAGMYALMGLALGAVYLKTRDIRYPVAVHMLNNILGLSMIYMQIQAV